MYSIKANATGSLRWIAKLLLNSLYGIFGRQQELLKTMIVNNEDLPLFFTSSIVKSVSHIDDNKSSILIHGNINKQILNVLNSILTNISSFEKPVKANVAIAAAITAYARIHMNQFKQNNHIIYTDTDSIITTKPLSENLLGNELGMFNDEY